MIGLVHEGDSITVDAQQQLLQLNVDAAELERRKQAWVRPEPRYRSGVLASTRVGEQQQQRCCDRSALNQFSSQALCQRFQRNAIVGSGAGLAGGAIHPHRMAPCHSSDGCRHRTSSTAATDRRAP